MQKDIQSLNELGITIILSTTSAICYQIVLSVHYYADQTKSKISQPIGRNRSSETTAKICA